MAHCIAERASILAKKRAEVQKANLAEMLKAVEGEEGVSEIDVETEEGRNKLEGMVGEKLAENLMTRWANITINF